MLRALFKLIPLWTFYPVRRGAVDLKRGSIGRSFCIAVIKFVKNHYELSRRLSVIRPLDMPEISLNAINSMVLDAVYWFGVQGYEGRVADVWVALCAQSRSILEVGGNIGLFTVIGARASAAVYTVVEPNPAVVAALRENLSLNDISHVELIQAAAIPGLVSKEVSLQIPSEGGRDAPVGAHLVDGVEVSGRGSEHIISVLGWGFSALLEGRDLIKIDAEGIECELLTSARDLILKTRPTMLIEVLPEAANLGRFLSNLAIDAGYAIHILPEYGSDKIVKADPKNFASTTPKKFNSKDVVLSAKPLPIISV